MLNNKQATCFSVHKLEDILREIGFENLEVGKTVLPMPIDK